MLYGSRSQRRGLHEQVESRDFTDVPRHGPR